jgi:Family of unknown function (DUF5701)
MSLLSVTTTPTEAEIEFDRQVDALTQAGLPGLLDVKDECFRAMLEPLRDLLPPPAARGGGIPFVVVVPEAPVADLLPSVHTPGGEGGTALAPAELAGFAPQPELDVPGVPYLLLDVDLDLDLDAGAGTVGLSAGRAAAAVAAAGRTPLTLAEGVAVLLCDCGVLRTWPSFALLGSRDSTGRHPALRCLPDGPRLTGERSGRGPLGLGTASCAARRAP